MSPHCLQAFVVRTKCLELWLVNWPPEGGHLGCRRRRRSANRECLEPLHFEFLSILYCLYMHAYINSIIGCTSAAFGQRSGVKLFFCKVSKYQVMLEVACSKCAPAHLAAPSEHQGAPPIPFAPSPKVRSLAEGKPRSPRHRSAHPNFAKVRSFAPPVYSRSIYNSRFYLRSNSYN